MTALDPTALEAAAKALFEVYGGYDAETKAHMFMMEQSRLKARAARCINAYLAAVRPERAKRLCHAIEGERDGLAITAAQADAIIDYIDTGADPLAALAEGVR